MRPEHTEPRGEQAPGEVRRALREQVEQCQRVLDRLLAGEGVLYRITMSVNGLAKTDVCQYVYFLAQHAKRHLAQLQRIQAAYDARGVG